MPLAGATQKNRKQALRQVLVCEQLTVMLSDYTTWGNNTCPSAGGRINTHWRYYSATRGMKCDRRYKEDLWKHAQWKKANRRPLLCDSIHRRLGTDRPLELAGCQSERGCPQGPASPGDQPGWCWLHNTTNLQNVLNHTPLNGLFHIMNFTSIGRKILQNFWNPVSTCRWSYSHLYFILFARV